MVAAHTAQQQQQNFSATHKIFGSPSPLPRPRDRAPETSDWIFSLWLAGSNRCSCNFTYPTARA